MNVHSLQFTESFIRPVLDNGVSKVVQFSFPKGKVLEKHQTTSDILVFVLQGQIRFTVHQEAQEETILQAGDLLSLEKNIPHSLEALEQSVVVLTLTPSPVVHTTLIPKIEEKPRAAASAPQANSAVSPQLQSFVEEHRELLQVLENAAGGQYRADAYARADKMIAEELNQHFRYEEEILFPLLGKYIPTNAGPIAVMLSEHKIIRDNHATFRKRLADLSAHPEQEQGVVQAFSALAGVLQSHIMKEDSVLFPMASGVMSQADQDEVARRVQAEKDKLSR